MQSQCDIILLSYNNPDLLKRCVQSIFDYTRIPVNLIIIDNASADSEVITYLQGLNGADNITIKKIFNNQNEGFASGMNKGMRLSGAPFICLLNNDCIVSDGWLEELIKIAQSRNDIGLVNPQSSTFGSYPVDSNSMNQHASLLRAKTGKYVELGHAIGFACLIKREVVNAIGYLDDAYNGVCYEDTDFSVRAQKAGFISVMAEGSYVYHFIQASRKNLKNKKEIYRRNKKIFEDRWGKLLRVLFYNHHRVSDSALFKDYEILRQLSRQRVFIEMWSISDTLQEDIPDRFEKFSVIRHADIGLKIFSRPIKKTYLLWRALVKKKKYNAIIVSDKFLYNIFRLLRFFCKGEVFLLTDDYRMNSGKRPVFNLKYPSGFAEYLRK